MGGALIGESLLRRLRNMLRWWESGGGRLTQATGLTAIRQPPFVRFYNGLGVTIPAYGVLAIRDMQRDHAGFPYVEAVRVSEVGQGPLLVNGWEAVRSDNYGFGLMLADEPREAAYYGDDPQTGDRLGVKPDSFNLWQYLPGFRACSDGDGGKVWVVRDPWSGLILAKTESEIAPNSSGNVSLWVDTVTPIGITVEASDPLNDESENPQAIEADKWVYVGQHVDGSWYVHEPPCPSQTP